jgi:hypothetical protein
MNKPFPTIQNEIKMKGYYIMPSYESDHFSVLPDGIKIRFLDAQTVHERMPRTLINSPKVA